MKPDRGKNEVEVVCHSGYKANEMPLSFILEKSRVDISEILERRYGQDCDYFKVLGDDGHIYMLVRNREKDVWGLEKIVESTDYH